MQFLKKIHLKKAFWCLCILSPSVPVTENVTHRGSQGYQPGSPTPPWEQSRKGRLPRADGWDRSAEPQAPWLGWCSSAKDKWYLSCWKGTWHHPSEEQTQQSSLDRHRHPKIPQTPSVITMLLVQAVLCRGQLPESTKQHQQVLLLFSRGALPA